MSADTFSLPVVADTDAVATSSVLVQRCHIQQVRGPALLHIQLPRLEEVCRYAEEKNASCPAVATQRYSLVTDTNRAR